MRTFNSLSLRQKRKFRDRYADKLNSGKRLSKTQMAISLRLFIWTCEQEIGGRSIGSTAAR